MSLKESYNIPKSSSAAQIEIKKSLFIANIYKTTRTSEVHANLKKLKLQYPKANHHCYAFILGHPSDHLLHGMSDDGEPKNTAGKPMLHILKHTNLGQILTVVTRFFGGIKLGTGGLVKAYSQATQEALAKLETETFHTMTKVLLSGPFKIENCMRNLITKNSLSILDTTYTHEVAITVEIPLHLLNQFEYTATNESNGLITCNRLSS